MTDLEKLNNDLDAVIHFIEANMPPRRQLGEPTQAKLAIGRLQRVKERIPELFPQAAKQEKRFTVTFSMEGPEFQDRMTARAIQNVLGTVSGHVATRRLSGRIHAAHARHEVVTVTDRDIIGEWTCTWAPDPPAA